ncbi:MAG TPA: hypothetical protein VMM76_25640 [Pirellulaceae bacterium]|nr:hypothetical protein [Pirellulaceae bacterium]
MPTHTTSALPTARPSFPESSLKRRLWELPGDRQLVGGKSGTQPEGLKQISPGQSEAAKPRSAALGHEAT